MKSYHFVLVAFTFIFGACQQHAPNPMSKKGVEQPEIDEVCDSLIGVYLLSKPASGSTVDYGYVAETNLKRMNRRMEVLQDSLMKTYKQSWSIDTEGAYDTAEYRMYIEKNLLESQASFQKYIESMGNLHTPGISGFGGSGTDNTKMEFQTLLIRNRILELKALLENN